MSTRTHRNMLVFSETRKDKNQTDASTTAAASSTQQQQPVITANNMIECPLLGGIELIADIQTVNDVTSYYSLLDQRQRATHTQRTTKTLDRSTDKQSQLSLAPEHQRLLAQNQAAVAAAHADMLQTRDKRTVADRRIRHEAEEVKQLIFELYSSNGSDRDAYSWNEIQEFTNEPDVSLREVLGDIAEYHTTGQYRQKYTLKYATSRNNNNQMQIE